MKVQLHVSLGSSAGFWLVGLLVIKPLSLVFLLAARMSQETIRGAIGPGEERPTTEISDRKADDAQNSRGSDKAAGTTCMDSGEKSPTDTPERGEAESATNVTTKDLCLESAQDTALPEVTVGSGNESKTKTPTDTKKETDSCSKPLDPSSQGSSVSTNEHSPQELGSDQRISQSVKVEAAVSKEGGGNADMTTQENPVLHDLESHKELDSSEQEKTKAVEDSKDDSPRQEAPGGQKTTKPIMPGTDGGDTLAKEATMKIEAGSERKPASTSPGPEGDGFAEFYQVIDDRPPPSAPFPHRLVTLRPGDVKTLFNINIDEMLGGGRFGDVHTCTEKSTGLQLVAKVIKIQDSKEKEMVLNEVEVMNQLNHQSLIQMYDALEMPGSIFLFLEYVEGGELFERIIDENYNLTEMDAMVFVRQICDGIFYMHQMYVLHLDLKPENIVCVSQTGHTVKIIDFGLARRYKPREKLRVSFGTPEFLAPEVVHFDYVSFPTDMWSLGVITYMMLSGLSPFLGDNDTETMNNVLSSEVDFSEEPFENVSHEAKDFISNLLIRDKNGRLSASQCLRHPWLNDLAEKAKRCNRLLKSQIELRKYMMRRRWKKNFIAVTAANRFKKISSVTSLATLGM